jgi:hypothetical protein
MHHNRRTITQPLSERIRKLLQEKLQDKQIFGGVKAEITLTPRQDECIETALQQVLNHLPSVNTSLSQANIEHLVGTGQFLTMHFSDDNGTVGTFLVSPAEIKPGLAEPNPGIPLRITCCVFA